MPGPNPRIAFFFACFFAAHAASAQVYFKPALLNRDSLLRVLDTAQTPARVQTLCLLAWESRIRNPRASIKFAQEAFELANDQDDDGLRLLGTNYLGMAFHHAGDYPKSIHYGLDALRMAVDRNDTAQLYQIFHYVVLSYLYSNNPELAIAFTHKGASYLFTSPDPFIRFEMNIRLGWIYLQAGKYREAIPYFRKAATIAEASGQVPPANMGLNYFHAGNCYMMIQDYDSALYFMNRGNEVRKQYLLSILDHYLVIMGRCYLRINRPETALEFFKEGIALSQSEGEINTLAENLGELGDFYRHRRQVNLAIQAYHQMSENAEWIRDNRSFYLDTLKNLDYMYTSEQSVPHFYEARGLEFLMHAHRNLYEIYKGTGNNSRALSHLEAYNDASARSLVLKRNKDVIEINTRYETERKEQQILLLTSENELNALKLENTRNFLYALAGFIILVILVGLLLIRQYRMKNRQDKIILEQRLFRAQMNPHFLFNTLTNIQGFMLENDLKKAGNYLTRFARLMRNILDNTSSELVSLEQEISTLENYFELQLIRYPGKFTYAIELDPAIDPEITSIPPMLFQPFIENAIEHGIRHLNGTGKISVKFSRQNEASGEDILHCEIEDNGVGRERSAALEKDYFDNHKPMATSITMDRLNSYPRRIRRRIRFQITDLLDRDGHPSGTRVSMGFPASVAVEGRLHTERR